MTASREIHLVRRPKGVPVAADFAVVPIDVAATGDGEVPSAAIGRLVMDALRGFDPARPVYVESESKKVGDLAVPEGLMACMRAAPCLDLQLPFDERVALLLEDYEFFVHNRDALAERLGALTALRGKVMVQRWQSLAQAGDFDAVVRELLEHHYDPGYAGSMVRNFSSYANATALPASDRSADRPPI